MINVDQPIPVLPQQAEQAGVDRESKRLPFQWAEDGNGDRDALVADLDRVDNAMRGGAIFTL